VQIAGGLSEETKRLIRGTPFEDRQGELLKLARRGPGRQEAAGRVLAAGGVKTVAQAARAVWRAERREALAAKAEAAARNGTAGGWEVRHGDCLEQLARVEPGSVRLVFADPPYNEGVDYGHGVQADRLPDDVYLGWCRDWMAACARLLTPDGSLWVLISHRYGAGFEGLLHGAGLHPRAWITWYETFGVNCTRKFNRTSRRLLYFTRDRRRFIFHPEAVNRPSDRQDEDDPRADPGGKLWDDVWGIDPPIPRLVDNHPERLPDFPTQLPLALLRPVVGCASDPGDLVLDPFSGSATTGAVCVEQGRRFLGVEKQAHFVKLSRQRLLAAGATPAPAG
jgi:DNA modification methylase